MEYTYYDISTKLGGTGDLTVDNLQIIASDLFEDWSPIAARVFDTSQRVTFHNTGNWGEYFGAGVEEDDEKTDIAKYFRGGMNPDAYRHGDTSSDNTQRVLSTTKLDSTALRRIPVLSESHVTTLRYQSSNPKIATVSKSGRILAKSKGTCKVYVIAANGIKKTVKVMVR